METIACQLTDGPHLAFYSLSVDQLPKRSCEAPSRRQSRLPGSGMACARPANPVRKSPSHVGGGLLVGQSERSYRHLMAHIQRFIPFAPLVHVYMHCRARVGFRAHRQPGIIRALCQWDDDRFHQLIDPPVDSRMHSIR